MLFSNHETETRIHRKRPQNIIRLTLFRIWTNGAVRLKFGCEITEFYSAHVCVIFSFSDLAELF